MNVSVICDWINITVQEDDIEWQIGDLKITVGLSLTGTIST
jgi:hypothetical protein